MLDLRLYRASLLPFLLAVVVAAFSPSSLPPALSSPLPPDVFNGARAYATLERLAAQYPHRAPGSPGDDALAAYVAGQLQADGLSVRMRYSTASTSLGRRRIVTVIATRAAAARGGPIRRQALVLLADRDAAGDGAGPSLSGTATLLELASDLSAHGERRPLTFISTTGVGDGDAGALVAAAAIRRPVDAVIVIGDLAGARARAPLVVPWSPSGGAASLQLQQTLDSALGAQLAPAPELPGVLEQLARFAAPLTIGEQGAFAAAGFAAALVQQRGELGPPRGSLVSAPELGAFGRAILAAVDAIENAPRLRQPITRDLTLASDRLGGWISRLLVGLLILAMASCTLDVFARARRRQTALAAWLAWLLWWAAPFLIAGACAKLLAWSSLFGPWPPSAVSAQELPIRLGGIGAIATVGLVFALACALRVRLIRTPARIGSEAADGAPVILLCLACALAASVWVANPYTAALLALPLVAWVPLMAGESYRSRAVALTWLLASLLPLGLALAAEASSLGLGPLDFAWTWLHVFASGEVGLAALLACSLAGAITIAAGLILLRPAAGEGSDIPITVRGPASYAGPGSLGGTESALRKSRR